MASDRDNKWLHPETGQPIGYRSVSGHYVIRKSIGGRDDRKNYERSTGQTDVFLAFAEYQRFVGDPASYTPAGGPLQPGPSAPPPAPVQSTGPAPLYLTPELIDEHIEHGERVGNLTSPDWVRNLRSHLKYWMVTLHGVNLRRLPKGMTPRPAPSPEGCDLGLHILAPLQKKDASGKLLVAKGTAIKRISSIKALYVFLREAVFRIEPEEDPTLNRLKNKKSEKAQRFGQVEKVNSIADAWKVVEYWEKTSPALNQHATGERQNGNAGRLSGNQWKADILILHIKTPWHFSEIARFCDPAEPDSQVVTPENRFWKEEWRKDDPDTVAVIAARAKAKKQIARFKMDQRGYDAATRLRERGKIGDPHHFRDQLCAACDAVGVGRLFPGRFRHSYLTNATNDGAEVSDVIAAANHASQATSAIYTEGAVPKKAQSSTSRGALIRERANAAEVVTVLDVPKRLDTAR
jgi:hypothetical protein